MIGTQSDAHAAVSAQLHTFLEGGWRSTRRGSLDRQAMRQTAAPDYASVARGVTPDMQSGFQGPERGVRLVGGVLFYSAAWLDDRSTQATAIVKPLLIPHTYPDSSGSQR